MKVIKYPHHQPGSHWMYEGEHVVVVEDGGVYQPRIKFLSGFWKGCFCQTEDSSKFIAWED